jgi:FAD/FMN-containing dehydrogenase
MTTFTLKHADHELFAFRATAENIGSLERMVKAAKPQPGDFLAAATRLMDAPDRQSLSMSDITLLVFMAFQQGDGIAEIIARKNVVATIVRHDDEGVFHLLFATDDDDADDQGRPMTLN